MNAVLFGVWAFAAGVLIPVLAALNGGLGRALGSPEWATVVPFAIALAASLTLALVRSPVPSLAAFQAARPEHFLGGLIVAFYLLSATFLTPRFGVGPTVLCVVVAQIVMSALIGQFGWLGAPKQPIQWVQAAGLALMVGGLCLAQLRRL